MGSQPVPDLDEGLNPGHKVCLQSIPVGMAALESGTQPVGHLPCKCLLEFVSVGVCVCGDVSLHTASGLLCLQHSTRSAGPFTVRMSSLNKNRSQGSEPTTLQWLRCGVTLPVHLGDL